MLPLVRPTDDDVRPRERELMFRLRTIVAMWLARRLWRLASAAYRRRRRRRLRVA
jgi:hypothetical protein